MSNVIIKELDYVYCKIVKGVKLIESCLSYPSFFYKRMPRGDRVRIDYRKKLTWKGGLILSGFVPKIREYCERQKIELTIQKEGVIWPPEKDPHVDNKNITSGEWSFQQRLIRIAIEKQRGVIKAATGSGKTTIMQGIISCYPSSNILFLSNTHTPITQLDSVLTDKQKKQVTRSTVQAFYRKNPKKYMTKYDIVLVDEAHEGMNFDGMYSKVLTHCLAPMRFGFTATLPKQIENRFALEGLLGPVIGELSIKEGLKRGILVQPKIKLKMVPFKHSIKSLRSYKEVYKTGIVENRALNRLVVMDTIDDLKKDRRVLILVQELAHGENIVEMAKKLYDTDLLFVYGTTQKNVRQKIRDSMVKGDLRAIVASAVFRKALDIPNLDVVNLAGVGKSATMILQAIGRGLRRAKGKNRVIIRDYFDESHHYLISHFGNRLSIYFQNKWL